MSENVQEAESNEVPPEEVHLAESQEQSEFLAAQNTYLKRRAVVLRLQINRLKAEVESLRDQLPKDAEEGPSVDDH